MKQQTMPRARQEGLLVQELPDEVLVYDQERHKAHCLNKTAALVWKSCDGQASVSAVAKQLEQTIGASVDEDVVWCALNQLEKDHLLEEKVTWPVGVKPISRRELMRRLGIGAAIAVPLITSIIAPTAAYAGSQPNSGASCNGDQDCTGGTHCQGGFCF